MKILVTGANGFIAKNFIKFSLNKGIKVTALSRKKKSFSNKNLKWVRGKMEKIDFTKYSKFDVLVHFAAAGIKANERNEIDKIFEVNVYKSSQMVINAIKNNCKKFLIISSSSEFGETNIKSVGIKKNDIKNPSTIYGYSKVIFNKIILKFSKKYKCKFRVMRLFPVYGDGENQDRLYSTIKNCSKNNGNLFLKNPFEIRDFSHIDFVVKILFDALNFNKKKFKYYQTYHVSESNKLTILKFCTILWKRFNCLGKIKYKNRKRKLTNHISNKNSNWIL